jgi:hypothetical protein
MVYAIHSDVMVEVSYSSSAVQVAFFPFKNGFRYNTENSDENHAIKCCKASMFKLGVTLAFNCRMSAQDRFVEWL